MAHATFVKKSRKKIPESRCGIEGGIPKGSSYWHWSFRRGGKRYSLTQPKRSQLTMSGFYATIFDIEDDMIAKATLDNIVETVQNVKDELDNLRDETQGSLDNMPDSLQEGPTGELLQERAQWCEDKISELDSIDVDDDSDRETKESAVEELQGMDFTDTP